MKIKEEDIQNFFKGVEIVSKDVAAYFLKNTGCVGDAISLYMKEQEVIRKKCLKIETFKNLITIVCNLKEFQKKGEIIALSTIFFIDLEKENVKDWKDFSSVIIKLFCGKYCFFYCDYHVESFEIKNRQKEKRAQEEGLKFLLGEVVFANITRRDIPEIKDLLLKWESSKKPSKVNIPIKSSSEKTQVCFVGGVSCGKSSLVNFILSGKIKYVCPSRTERCTSCITYHEYTPEKVNVFKIRKEISLLNKVNSTKVGRFKSFSKKELKDFVFVDTPGLDDKTKFDDGKMFDDKIRSAIKESDIVVFLVNPERIVESRTKENIERIITLTPRILVCLTMFDKIIEDERDEMEDTYEREVENLEVISRVTYKWMKEYSLLFSKYGPLCWTQIKQPISGDYFETTGLLLNCIRDFAKPEIKTYIGLKYGLHEYMKKNSLLPIQMFNSFKKSEKKKNLLKWGIIGAILGAPVIVISGVVIVVTGGVVLFVGGISAAAITGFLASVGFGGGMVGGIIVIGATSAMGASGLVVVGSIVGGGLGVGLTNFLVNTSPQTMSVLGTMIPNSKLKNIIPFLKLEEKEYEKLLKQLEECLIMTKKKKKFLKEEVSKGSYEDISIVRYMGSIYLVNGLFRNGVIFSINEICKLEKKDKYFSRVIK